MRHHVAGKKLGRTTAHREAMFRNMVTSLVLNDRVETTLPKAKELRRLADQMVTLAKDDTIYSRRRAMTVLRNRTAMHKLYTTLADRYKDRNGGYTRVLKLGRRHGDDAKMAVVEYLTAEVKKRGHEPEQKVSKSAVAKPMKKGSKPAEKKAKAKTQPVKKKGSKKKEGK